MKIFIVAVALSGCGGSEETATSAEGNPGARTAAETAQAQKEPEYPLPTISVKKKGPLEKVVVKDLEVGKGRVARWGDEVAVRYVGKYYQTGKLYSQHWGFTLEFKLDGESYGTGWQKAVQGMRVGGRREALIPARQFFEHQDMAYVIALVWVKPG